MSSELWSPANPFWGQGSPRRSALYHAWEATLLGKVYHVEMTCDEWGTVTRWLYEEPKIHGWQLVERTTVACLPWEWANDFAYQKQQTRNWAENEILSPMGRLAEGLRETT
jgi:hypothetical protein